MITLFYVLCNVSDKNYKLVVFATFSVGSFSINMVTILFDYLLPSLTKKISSKQFLSFSTKKESFNNEI